MENQLIPPTEIKTTSDLAKALLKAAGLAANGSADVGQVNSLCSCTNTLIKLARLQIEANEGRTSGVHWLTEGRQSDEEADASVANLGNLKRDLSLILRELDDPKTPENRLPALRAKRNNLQQEVLLLERSQRTRSP
jgi:hypothetical protein